MGAGRSDPPNTQPRLTLMHHSLTGTEERNIENRRERGRESRVLSISCSSVLYSRSVVFSCFHLPAPAICHLATAQKKKNGSSEPPSSLPFSFPSLSFSSLRLSSPGSQIGGEAREKTHIYRCAFLQRSPVKPTRVILCVLFLMGAGFPPRVKSFACRASSTFITISLDPRCGC